MSRTSPESSPAAPGSSAYLMITARLSSHVVRSNILVLGHGSPTNAATTMVLNVALSLSLDLSLDTRQALGVCGIGYRDQTPLLRPGFSAVAWLKATGSHWDSPTMKTATKNGTAGISFRAGRRRDDDGMSDPPRPHLNSPYEISAAPVSNAGLTTGIATTSTTSAGTNSEIVGILPLNGT